MTLKASLKICRICPQRILGTNYLLPPASLLLIFALKLLSFLLLLHQVRVDATVSVFSPLLVRKSFVYLLLKGLLFVAL